MPGQASRESASVLAEGLAVNGRHAAVEAGTVELRGRGVRAAGAAANCFRRLPGPTGRAGTGRDGPRGRHEHAC
nr:hypothetical protein KitaXyl93_77880 [Kitasatospora sp. Xyl93]